MEKIFTALEAFLSHPILWGVLALIALAVALSGKLSVSAASTLLWIAYAAAVFGIFRAEAPLRNDPALRYLLLMTVGGLLAIGALFIQRWFAKRPTEAAVSIQKLSPNSATAPSSTTENHGTNDKLAVKAEHSGTTEHPGTSDKPIVTVEHRQSPKPRTPIPLRITGFVADVAIGKAIALRVRYINNADESARLYSKYGYIWIEQLPDEADLKAVEELEESVWDSMINGKPISIPGTTSVGEKTFLTAPPKINLEVTAFTDITATPEIIAKLDNKSAIYFTGIMMDTNDHKVAEFCVRLDQYRNHEITLCKDHN